MRTQEQFITILKEDVDDLEALFQVIDSAPLPANMFLKHLMLLADFGGEALMRVNSQFAAFFPSGTLEYIWKGKRHEYHFTKLPVQGDLNNNKVGVSGKRLLKAQRLDNLLMDVIVLILFGNALVELERFIRERYIWVSRITGGAQANTYGQLAQAFVREYIEKYLSVIGMSVMSNGHLPNVTHTFDIVVSNNAKYVGIEVSFQEATNSTYERKAGQAHNRYEQVHNAGHRISYVLDGAGNFQRESALRTLCQYSDCTVAFSSEELDVLCQFIREYFAE
jgi:hypothetical protein